VEQLTKKSNGNHNQWSLGCANCGERYWGRYRISIGVNCRIDNNEDYLIAMLDTACTVSLVGGDFARQIKAEREVSDLEVTIDTRLGEYSGPLIRANITVFANCSGKNIDIDGTFMLSEAWPGPPIVLGCNGFLERVRIALEPTDIDKDYLFYFGK
jgi:hypothetical protein